jgi:hypothetical protein
MNLTGEVIGVYDLASPDYYGKLLQFVFYNDSTLVGSASWGSQGSNPPKAVVFDTLGNIKASSFLLDNHYLSYVRKTYDDKFLFFTNIMDEQTYKFDAYLFKLDQDLNDDTIYTYPFKYDSLCPYPIESDTITQEGCDIIVGIEEEEEMRSDEDVGMMELFPNPATNEINCRLSTVNCQCIISIYDIWGRKMDAVSIPANQEQISIDISNFPPGIYIAVLKSERKMLDRKKFVVQRL